MREGGAGHIEKRTIKEDSDAVCFEACLLYDSLQRKKLRNNEIFSTFEESVIR